MRKVTCVFLLLSIVATLWSQTKVWTLKECMEYAVQNNTRVSSQEARNKIHTQNYREAVARLLPSVEADVSANFNFGRGLDSETNTYTDINSFGNTYGISSGVVLFDGLAGITRARIQKVNALLGKHQLQEAKDLTAYETMEAFFNSLYYREMVELARQQWQESSKNLQRTQRMEELGLKASPDVAELAAKEAADSYNLTRQKNLLQISIIHLKEKMYFPIEEELQIAGMILWRWLPKRKILPLIYTSMHSCFCPLRRLPMLLCVLASFLIGPQKAYYYRRLRHTVEYLPGLHASWMAASISLFPNNSKISVDIMSVSLFPFPFLMDWRVCRI